MMTGAGYRKSFTEFI